MKESLSSHPVFISLDELLMTITKAIPEPFRPKTTAQLVVGGLCHKIYSHCISVKNLMLQGNLAEAIIILRATYESVILALYLSHNESETAFYEKHSILIEAKDIIVAYSRADENDKRQFGTTITELKQKIIKDNLLAEGRYFKRNRAVSPDILDNAEEFADAMKVHFCPIRKMRDDLKEKDKRMYGLLKDLDFQIYNYGSQLSHSYWHCVKDYFVSDEKPNINLYQLILYSLISLDAMVTALEKIGMLQSTRTELDPEFKRVGNELSKIRPAQRK